MVDQRNPDTPITDTYVFDLEMSEKGFGVAGVVDAVGRLTGIITDGDLRRNMEGLLDKRASEVATSDPRTIGPDALAQEALALMNGREPRITTLFVIDESHATVPQIGGMYAGDRSRKEVLVEHGFRLPSALDYSTQEYCSLT